MNINKIIEKLQQKEKLKLNRVVVCSEDGLLVSPILGVMHMRDAVIIETNIKYPFTQEEIVFLRDVIGKLEDTDMKKYIYEKLSYVVKFKEKVLEEYNKFDL